MQGCAIIAINFESGTVTTCTIGNKKRELHLTREQAQRVRSWWMDSNAPMIQDAFPDLTDSQREQILTGMNDEEWDELFAEQEE